MLFAVILVLLMLFRLTVVIEVLIGIAILLKEDVALRVTVVEPFIVLEVLVLVLRRLVLGLEGI